MSGESTYTSQLLRCGSDHFRPCCLNPASFLAKNQFRKPLGTKSSATTSMHSALYPSITDCQGDHLACSGSIGLMAALKNHKKE